MDDTLKRRVRIIRNLIEASENQIRLNNMPLLVTEVEDIALNGLHSDSTSFNRGQFDEELVKGAFLETHPHLTPTVFELEDHEILRGSLVAFELDANSLPQRTSAFSDLFCSREH